MNRELLTHLLKKQAAGLGFQYCGIARAERLDDDARRLERWLNKGYQGKMQYLEKHFDLRVDPTKLVPGAKSVITLLLNYFPKEKASPEAVRISTYAWGNDYHEVIREKLTNLYQYLQSVAGEVQGRGFVDSAPVLERSWAQKSGLGWIGKNGNLIHQKAGSFFFIATLITDIELEYDDPLAKDYCGSCTRCIDACPTDAILPDKTINGSQCISYFTIELKDALLPQEMKGKFDNWAFGCDTCQDVCPWNRFAIPTTEPAFTPIPEILEMNSLEWLQLNEEEFRKRFRHSPLKRTKWSGLQRNLKFIYSAH